jgi:saccharopine dehydrogenase (NADP+, L-glutamate forming)
MIRFLVVEGRRYGWKTCVGSMFEFQLPPKIKEEKFSNDVVFIHFTDMRQCDHAIRKADLVVAMMSDQMILQIADLCIANRKSLITPARLTRQLHAKKAKAEENEVLLLAECGFAPGLDHITAKKMIDNIHLKNGRITSFKTFSGSLLAENCVTADSPLQFKLTEPAADLIQLGKGTNRHLINGKIQHISYHQLFTRGEPISMQGVRNAIVLPEGDALYCRRLYGLNQAHTVIKGKIFREGFDRLWHLLINLGLTDSQLRIDAFDNASFYNYLESLLPYSDDEPLEFRLRKFMHASYEEIEKLKWLGWFDSFWVNAKEITPSMLLRFLLQKKATLLPHDKDCILMRHQLEYTSKEGRQHQFIATLLAQGEDGEDTALLKAIGLTAGAAAKMFLLNNIKAKGIHIPVSPEIYDPILNELDDLGVSFHIEEKRIEEKRSHSPVTRDPRDPSVSSQPSQQQPHI